LTANFKYDAFGRRIEKTVNGKAIQYLYDGIDIVQEIEGGTVLANYLRTLSIDEPLARITPGASRFYQADALGSIIAVIGENGEGKTTYTYDPFGNVTMSGELNDNPFQYTGRENDGTGLYYYRARYYSPELQKFISEDPIRFRGGSNFYTYVRNNPINFVDPLGLRWYESPAVWLDIAALTFDIGGFLVPPLSFPLLFVGAGISFANTMYAYDQWQKGNAEWYDFAVSAGTTLIGFYPHPVTVIGSDIVILIYDIYRAESKGRSCR
jgi:RHS repeat-associated protein